MNSKVFFNRAPLPPSDYAPLPLTAVKPKGWLLEQLRTQAKGITGTLYKFWPDVSDECAWLGGKGDAWERAPYYLDGLVPLAYLLGDEELIARAGKYIEWMLASQREDGFFGPKNNDDWWPRMVALKALIQYYTATTDERVPKFMLPNAGFETWTNSKTWYPCSADEIGSNGMGTGYTGFWGTGNPGANAAGIVVTEPADDPRPGSTGSKSALLKTQSAFGVIAAGNLFIGAFGGVHNITKGDVYMGRPFTFNARPKAITFWYKGTVGSGDKARFFVCMGKWSSYHKIDTNDQSTFFDPSQESLPEGPIYGHGDWLNDTSQSDWKKIVIPIEYRSDEKPNYLMVTASASYRGDYMEGNKESRMYIDDIEFVY